MTTAMALIEALRKDGSTEWNISWVGSKRAVEGSRELTLEFKVFPKMNIACHEIITGRVQRKWTRYTIWSLVKIPLGFLHALFLVVKIRPKVVVSFGGFAAFPIVVSSRILGTPVIIHDQTTGAGLANRLSSPFATKIAISRESSEKYFPVQKTILTGNPVREAFFNIPQKQKISNPPVIYATGGSRGSKIFNNKLMEALPEILLSYKIIHQCGDADLDKCVQFQSNLPAGLAVNYEVIGTVDPEEVPNLFSKADIVIGRAGANTVSEVIAARRPAIFVPIPWSQNDEQTKNAELAVEAGIGVILNQNGLTPGQLVESIKKITQNYTGMTRLDDESIRDLDRTAASRLCGLAASFL